MRKDIIVNLNEDSLVDATAEVAVLEYGIRKALEETVRSLTGKGQAAAQIRLGVANGVEFQDTPVHIATLYDDETNTGYVYAEEDEAVYLEYGAGFVGQNNPHPGITSGESTPPVMHNGDRTYTRYDTYNHGAEGWSYAEGGRTYHTAGWQGIQFMYDAYKDLEEIAPLEMQDALRKRGVMK